MKVFFAPSPRPAPAETLGKEIVFLGGSIEMGKAQEWQAAFVEGFENTSVVFLNPRRPIWDASWEQKRSNPVFNEQVNWELDSLDASTIAVFYFQPGTLSPITFAEFGSVLKDDKALVCCPEGFWRRGNIEVMCHRENIPFFETIEDLKAAVLRVIAG